MSIKLPPIGFWSYARQDDDASGGQLSSLRSRLMSELQQQYGREPIKIFQDVAAIPPGSAWREEITNALEYSTFLIPIITPAFLESEFCCEEIRIFLAREKRLNQEYPELAGRRRIFPILYMDIEDIDPFDPAVLDELRKIQWVDFSSLRFKADHDETVRMALADLARGVRKLLMIRVEPPLSPEERAKREKERQKREQEAAAAEKLARERESEAERIERERREAAAERQAQLAAERAEQRKAQAEAARKAQAERAAKKNFSNWFSAQNAAVKSAVILGPLLLLLLIVMAIGSSTPRTNYVANDSYDSNATMIDENVTDTMTGNTTASSLTEDEQALVQMVRDSEAAEQSSVEAAASGREAAENADRAMASAKANEAGYGLLTYRSTDGKSSYEYYGKIDGSLAQGYGVRTWATGETQKGNFSDDKFTGYGTIKFADGESFEGTFIDAAFNGFGIYYFGDGKRMLGKRYKTADGPSVMYYKDGSKFRGIYRNNDAYGMGAWFDTQGNFTSGGFYTKNSLTRAVAYHP